ncbi:redoxin domain-containing protein [Nocardiopsis aegyptia]|uniref:redoxin domain-containing protein n=1 Tax=Nocardiopsis aegyptia TaxID=220378 RepID=UPI00366AE76E
MRTNPRVTAVAAALAAALGLAACSAPDDAQPEAGTGSGTGADTGDGTGDGTTEEAHALPPFEAPTLDGEEFAASALEGEPAVLWFWAPWCTVCRSEAGGVAEAAERYEGQVEFIGVAGRGEVADMRAFTDDTGTGHLTHVVDEDGGIWSDFGVVSQPAFAFVRPDGTFETVAGTLSDEDLDARVDGTLPAGPDETP